MTQTARSTTLLLAALLGLSAASLATARDSAPWLHLRVTAADGSEKMNLNVPFSLAEGLLDLADTNDLNANVSEHLPGDMSFGDLRRMWEEAKKGGSQEFLRVDNEREKVRIAIQGQKLRLSVAETKGGLSHEKVQLELPVRVVDALLSSGGESLDLRAGLEELRRGGVGEILRVQDAGETVRLWIE